MSLVVRVGSNMKSIRGSTTRVRVLIERGKEWPRYVSSDEATVATDLLVFRAEERPKILTKNL